MDAITPASAVTDPADISQPRSKIKLLFHGRATAFFGIKVVQVVLAVLTGGVYYFWGQIKSLKYLCNRVELLGSRFSFHGTGLELLKHFLKSLGFAVIFLSVLGILAFVAKGISVPQNLLFSGIIIVLISSVYLLLPFVMHGGLSYKVNRTSWRGLRMHYSGTREDLFKIFLWAMPLLIITFGFYFPFLIIRLWEYNIGHIRLGNVTIGFKRRAKDYFLLDIKGCFLTIVTLGIYFFWWRKNRFNFLYGSIEITHDGQKAAVIPLMTTGAVFRFFLMEIVLAVTFGLALPWFTIQKVAYLLDHLRLSGNIDWNTIQAYSAKDTDKSGPVGVLNDSSVC